MKIIFYYNYEGNNCDHILTQIFFTRIFFNTKIPKNQNFKNNFGLKKQKSEKMQKFSVKKSEKFLLKNYSPFPFQNFPKTWNFLPKSRI